MVGERAEFVETVVAGPFGAVEVTLGFRADPGPHDAS